MGFLFNRKSKVPTQKADAYCSKFSIKSNTLPSPPGYDQLNDAEQKFFSELEHALVTAKLSPYDITLTRLSSGMFNVNHSTGYIGKINLRPKKNGDFYMQYFGPRGAIKELNTQAVDECMEAIPMWIRCIKRYQTAHK